VLYKKAWVWLLTSYSLHLFLTFSSEKQGTLTVFRTSVKYTQPYKIISFMVFFDYSWFDW